MRVLALEPFDGGSHRAFLDGWIAHSEHEWTVLRLPGRKWKWRMRHGPWTFADELRRDHAHARWDALWCSDMLDLAQFRGLAPEHVRLLPTVAYFHENQLTYPVREEQTRDYHFGFTNITTARAADAVWFNSAFNRDSFLAAIPAFLNRMPDFRPPVAAERIREKSLVAPPGIRIIGPPGEREPGPPVVLWAARWEHDKGPERFFRALRRAKEKGRAFRLSVVGERYAETPAAFAEAQELHRGRIVHWGFQASRADYEAALRESDLVISTAEHEFFGLSMVEAMSAGVVPLLPERLAYPEVLADAPSPWRERFLYRGGTTELTERLVDWLDADAATWAAARAAARRTALRFDWTVRAAQLDADLGRMSRL